MRDFGQRSGRSMSRARAAPRLARGRSLALLAGVILVWTACCAPAAAEQQQQQPPSAAAAALVATPAAPAAAAVAATRPAGTSPAPSSAPAPAPAVAAPPASPAPALRATVMPVTPMLMPICPREGVLDSKNPLVFPGRVWKSMSVEQQGMHPINLVFMNLAGVPTNEREGQITPCLGTWGIKQSSVVRIKKDYRMPRFPRAMTTEVLVMRSSRDVFVAFRATDDDWAADFNCMYTDELNEVLRAPPRTGKVQLHKGFWEAYKAVDKQLTQEVNRQLLLLKTRNPFNKPTVWFVGHSLGGALSSIAALKLSLDPSFQFLGDVGGVATYGMPRVGNEAWASLYNSQLMQETLRFANFRDFVSALPRRDQVCVSTTTKIMFEFRHVGRVAQMCPTEEGLEQFNFFPKGTEGSCSPGEFPSIATHLLGHYFDGWRRAYANKFGIPAGLLLSTGPHVRSVMCAQCATAVKPYPLPTNKAARNDGIVTCINTRSCADRTIFNLISWSGLAPTSFFREGATCDAATFTCQVPIPSLTGVTGAFNTLAANITLADLVAPLSPNHTTASAGAGAAQAQAASAANKTDGSASLATPVPLKPMTYVAPAGNKTAPAKVALGSAAAVSKPAGKKPVAVAPGAKAQGGGSVSLGAASNPAKAAAPKPAAPAKPAMPAQQAGAGSAPQASPQVVS